MILRMNVSPAIDRSMNGRTHYADIVDFFPPVTDGFEDRVVLEPLWYEEHLSAAEKGRAPSLPPELHAWVTPHIFHFVIGAAPATDAAETEWQSHVAPALVEPYTLTAPQTLTHEQKF